MSGASCEHNFMFKVEFGKRKFCPPRFVEKLVMGPGQKFLTQVGSIFCGLGRVSHLWFGFEFGKFPLKMSNFSFFSLRVGRKVPGSKLGRPLIYCGSKVSLGRVRDHLYEKQSVEKCWRKAFLSMNTQKTRSKSPMHFCWNILDSFHLTSLFSFHLMRLIGILRCSESYVMWEAVPRTGSYRRKRIQWIKIWRCHFQGRSFTRLIIQTRLQDISFKRKFSQSLKPYEKVIGFAFQ